MFTLVEYQTWVFINLIIATGLRLSSALRIKVVDVRVCILMNSVYYDEMNYQYKKIMQKKFYPSRYIKQLKDKFEEK